MAWAVENGKEKGERWFKIKLKNEALREKKRLQKEKDETENNNERQNNKDTKNAKKKIRIRSEANKEKNNEENNSLLLGPSYFNIYSIIFKFNFYWSHT